MKKTQYTHRLIARFVIESTTPLAVGTGEKSIITDSPVATDINGLPYIPGSSLAGVLRHSLNDTKMTDRLFGYQEGNEGIGSRLSFTDALMIGKDGIPMDGLQAIDFNNAFYCHFEQMPLRQHVRINGKGTADKQGKFDNQVVFKGTRFVFEIEFVSTGSDVEKTAFYDVLAQVFSDHFRIGGGTRSGFGHMKVVDVRIAELDLKKTQDLNLYLKKSACLSEPWEGFINNINLHATEDNAWKSYDFQLKPEGFFLFGSGFSDDDADMTPVVEAYVVWEGNKPHIEEGTVIPSTSIKGALSHRTAFHWNKLKQFYADKGAGKIGEDNPAVAQLFGCSGDGVTSDQITRGKVLIDDIIIPKCETKILNHVAIDQFTGGALEGALFTEKVNVNQSKSIDIHIMVDTSAFLPEDPDIKMAFENAIDDMKKGLLPLGGGVNRGNGVFVLQQ